VSKQPVISQVFTPCAPAGERCAGRLVSLLEGGYHLEALSRSVEAHVQELARAASCA
jgi:acetoin utilization deacetylase AcuC-like enzyme